MSFTSRSRRQTRLLAGVLAVDLGFVWLSVIHHEMLVILYSSGLWIGYEAGLGWALLRTILLLSAYHFRFPKLLVFMIGLELMAGVVVSVTDIWVYYATDCECLLQIDGAVARLFVRSAALGVLVGASRKTKEEGRWKG